jgi:hypothetical protein
MLSRIAAAKRYQKDADMFTLFCALPLTRWEEKISLLLQSPPYPFSTPHPADFMPVFSEE